MSCQLTRILHGRLWQDDLSAGNWRISTVINRCLETTIRECNRRRILVCVCQWSVKCSPEWCTYVVNKSIHQSIPRLQSLTPNSWQYCVTVQTFDNWTHVVKLITRLENLAIEAYRILETTLEAFITTASHGAEWSAPRLWSFISDTCSVGGLVGH
jgi:hypothetical protein